MEDAAIVVLYWARDEQALSETAAKFGAYCRKIADNILHSAHDAEECENDTWLAAWNSMPDNRPARLAPYLGRITRNLALDRFDKTTAQKRGCGQSFAPLDELAECVSLLRDISTLNRLDDGSDMIDFEAVDITKMVADIARETTLEREERKMTFINQLPERIVVKGNRSLLYSVFRNLTDNAIAYAGEGTTMTLEGREQGNKWHFIFRDNGQGVPQEHLPRLFERFYRVDKGRSRKMGGTGLGLAIVKNAVLLHGGTIRVSNLPEGGLKFEFTIKK